MSTSVEPIRWEADLPLFSRVMLVQWTGAMLATWAMIVVILGPIFIARDEADSFVTLLLWLGICTAGVWLLGLLIMAVLFRGRVRMRYVLDGRGIRCESIDSVARSASRLATVAGAVTGRAGLAGAGLLAMSRESESVSWKGAYRAVFRPGAGVILLRNSWRTLMWIQCPAEDYARVAEAVQRQMAAHHTAERVGGGPGLLSYLGSTVLVSLACLPLFFLAEEFDTGLFAALFVYCFALAMVWMVPLFAYAVLGGLAVVAAMLGANLLEVRESTLFPGRSYRGLDVLGDNDLALLAAAAAGTLVLVWLSWRYLSGRTQSALVAGMGQMSGE